MKLIKENKEENKLPDCSSGFPVPKCKPLKIDTKIKLIKFKNIITNEFYKSKQGKDYFIAYDEPMSNEIAQQADNFRAWLNADMPIEAFIRKYGEDDLLFKTFILPNGEQKQLIRIFKNIYNICDTYNFVFIDESFLMINKEDEGFKDLEIKNENSFSIICID
jgi:hypothetical protein